MTAICTAAAAPVIAAATSHFPSHVIEPPDVTLPTSCDRTGFCDTRLRTSCDTLAYPHLPVAYYHPLPVSHWHPLPAARFQWHTHS